MKSIGNEVTTNRCNLVTDCWDITGNLGGLLTPLINLINQELLVAIPLRGYLKQ